jgi:hypothetical protein
MAMSTQQSLFPTATERGAKWFNSPVKHHKGSLGEVRVFLPDFERREFMLAAQPGQPSRVNARMDAIVRKPLGTERDFIPVGVVSKDYALVNHVEVVEAAPKALEGFQIAAADVKAELTITEYGECMALSLYLPEKDTFDPGDGNRIPMRLECFNSVDGSTGLRALMGWFRLVCSNGLVVGVTWCGQRRHPPTTRRQAAKNPS